jgi:DNA (cytosine-5)-methyltransferase 1
MPFAFYNDTDEYCCTWLENLISARIIPYGVVDPTPIQKLKPATLAKFTQVHLFAGMGGWAYALRLAGWPDAKPVWTGSCPCQPFSVAGKRKAQKDSRHLWPFMYRLIRACNPECVLGEQVESAIGHGWLDGVYADLEREGYTTGEAVLGAHSVGAPHIRQRLWWVADCADHGRGQEPADTQRGVVRGRQNGRPSGPPLRGNANGLAHHQQPRLERGQIQPARQERPPVERSSGTGGLGESHRNGRTPGGEAAPSMGQGNTADPTGFWLDTIAIPCLDGKLRRIKSSIQPLADGVPRRILKLCAIGNTICIPTAVAFIRAYMACRADLLL